MTTFNLPAPKHTFQNEDVRAMLAKKGLDFNVKTIETPNPFDEGKTGFFTAYRDTDHKIFQQGLTAQWQPIQNQDVFTCVAELSKQTEAKLMDIRSFNDGTEIAAQISLGDSYVDKGEGGIGAPRDRISNYLSVIFAHNGTRSLSLYMTPHRWSCSNMINPSFRAAQQASRKGKKALITIQHSQSAQDKLGQLVKAVTFAHGEFKTSLDLFSTLRNTRVEKDLMEEVIRQYFPLVGTVDPITGVSSVSERQKTNYRMKMQDLMHRYSYADGGLQPMNSAWNVYNAAQGHIQHFALRNKGKVSEANYKSSLVGANESEAARVLRTVIEMSIGMGALNSLTVPEF